MKWKIMCMSKIQFKDKQVGKIKLKAKGKCSAEVWKEMHVRQKKVRDNSKKGQHIQKIEKLRSKHNLDGRPKICKIKAS